MNKVVLAGRLVKDPELRNTNSGNSMAKFSLAVTGMKTGEDEREVYYFDCVCYTKLAEAMATHCRKGDKVVVLGELTQRKYEAKDGTMRTVNEVFVREAEFQLKLVEADAVEEEPKPKTKAKGKKSKKDDLPF